MRCTAHAAEPVSPADKQIHDTGIKYENATLRRLIPLIAGGT